MLENLTTTQMLAALLGLYFLAAGTGLFVSRKEFSTMLKELSEQPTLGYLGGLIAFIVGGTIVAVHNIWSDLLSGVVSLIGWFALAEGVLMLACPKWFLGLIKRLPLSESFVTAMGLGTIVGGVVLLWAGLGR